MRGEQISKVINMSDDINKIAVELFPKCTIWNLKQVNVSLLP